MNTEKLKKHFKMGLKKSAKFQAQSCSTWEEIYLAVTPRDKIKINKTRFLHEANVVKCFQIS